jgi:hypothetical protein
MRSCFVRRFRRVDVNFLFLTQGSTLRLFHDIANRLSDDGRLSTAGFYVTDSQFYAGFVDAHPEFLRSYPDVLKEWEVLEGASRAPADPERLRDLERRIGDPTLWNAIVADRRLYIGRRAVREQDYVSRYSHDELMAIVQQAGERMEELFDRVKPDLVVGFICVTVGEYMAELVAKRRGIPFLNLRPTRIRNYFFGGESVQEPSEALRSTYERFLAEGVPPALAEQARAAIGDVRRDFALYEGVIPLAAEASAAPAGGAPAAAPARAPRSPGRVARLARTACRMWAFNLGSSRHDNHYEGYFAPLWFKRVKGPFRRRYTEWRLRRRYVASVDELKSLDYVFYPMHKEPEVTLLVYGRPFLNQIEVVRNIARSLPIGMKLVIKEHPMALGYRSLSYYRKLLDIPNVLLADPALTSRDLLANTRLVSIIGGSIGLEAMMRELPVVVFGRVPFSFLPDSMIASVGTPFEIADRIAGLLSDHRHDEEALEAYVAAVIESSVAVNFYSVLLGRGGGWRPTSGGTDDYAAQLGRLADYIVRRRAELQASIPEA